MCQITVSVDHQSFCSPFKALSDQLSFQNVHLCLQLRDFATEVGHLPCMLRTEFIYKDTHTKHNHHLKKNKTFNLLNWICHTFCCQPGWACHVGPSAPTLSRWLSGGFGTLCADWWRVTFQGSWQSTSHWPVVSLVALPLIERLPVLLWPRQHADIF